MAGRSDAFLISEICSREDVVIINALFGHELAGNDGLRVEVARTDSEDKTNHPLVHRPLPRRYVAQSSRIEAKRGHSLRGLAALKPGDQFTDVLGRLTIRRTFVHLT